MKKKDFDLLVLSVPRVQVSIENRGHYADASFKDEQIIVQNGSNIDYCIIWSGFISQDITYDAGTFYAPPVFEADDPTINITMCELFDEDDEEVTLTEDQGAELMTVIKESLQVDINPY